MFARSAMFWYNERTSHLPGDLTMRIREPLEKNRDEILRVAERHGATNVRIFGSVARGQDDSESDLDVLVDLEKGRSPMDHAALVIDLEDLLGCRVDVATERGLKERIRERKSAGIRCRCESERYPMGRPE